MGYFQIIVSCADIGPLVNFVKKGIWPVIQFVIPLLIIILGAVDLGKAVAGGDEKKTKEAQSAFMKRIIYGVAIFFVPLIVSLVFSTLQDQSKDDPNGYTFIDCWNGESKVDLDKLSDKAIRDLAQKHGIENYNSKSIDTLKELLTQKGVGD